MGNKAVTLDGFPLIGKTSLDNVWILSGTYREGFHLSPVLSDIMAAEMLGQQAETEIPYAIFSPERQPIKTMTKEEAIKDTVQQFVSSAYEHGMKLSHGINDHLLSDMLHSKIEKLYTNFGINFAIPAELVLVLEGKRLPSGLKNYLINSS